LNFNKYGSLRRITKKEVCKKIRAIKSKRSTIKCKITAIKIELIIAIK